MGWVLKLTPAGVFALAVPLAARMGLAAAGALAYFIVLLSMICAAFIVLLYPVAVLVGRAIRPRRLGVELLYALGMYYVCFAAIVLSDVLFVLCVSQLVSVTLLGPFWQVWLLAMALFVFVEW